jgi:hypothetical protein
LRLLLLLEEYGVTFEYLPGKKNVCNIADALSRLDIDSLKIQKEEVLTLLSGLENNSISNIKWTMHTALIFKEQAKVKDIALREKGLAQPHYSIQHIEGYDLLCYKKNLYSSIIEKEYTEYCPGTMNIYFIRVRLEQKRLSEIPWHGLVLHKMLNIDCLCSACQGWQMTKKKRLYKIYGLLLPKIAYSDPWVMVCVDLVGPLPFTIRIPAKTHSLLALTMIDPATVWFEILEATNKSATSIQDLFHNTWLACYPRPQFIVFDNGGEFKREFKQMCDNYGIKAKPTTSHNPQANAIIERVHKVVNDMLRSFDLENNHDNLEEQ